jgi:hypothetical protein
MTDLEPIASADERPRFETGHRYPERDVTRRRSWQDSRLAACAVDPASWGDRAELVLFGQDGFKAMAAGGHQVDGVVHIGQRYRQFAPVAIDEAVSQVGWIDRFEPHPRGQVFTSVFEIRRADGSLAVVSELTRLIPDPARMGVGAATSSRSSGPDRAAPTRSPGDPTEGLALVAEKTMRPDDVTLFSGDVGNLIHFDPDFARGLGYRAPLAQGLQTAVWLLSGLVADGVPEAMEVEARFRRPVHWDDPMSLWRGERDGAAFALSVDPEGRPTAEMWLRPTA